MQGYIPSTMTEQESFEAWAEKYAIQFPINLDQDNREASRLGATIAPQAIIENVENKSIEYTGRINDLYKEIGKQSRYVKNHDLRNAIEQLKIKRDVTEKSTLPIGCFITFEP